MFLLRLASLLSESECKSRYFLLNDQTFSQKSYNFAVNNTNMEQRNNNILPRECKLIAIKTISDERGNLCVADETVMPFKVERTFWIHDVPAGKTRGGHAHQKCAEVLFPLSGSFDIMVDDGKTIQEFHMQSPSEGIYIGPYVWCELRNFAPGTICLAFASHPYMYDGYIKDYEAFRNINH